MVSFVIILFVFHLAFQILAVDLFHGVDISDMYFIDMTTLVITTSRRTRIQKSCLGTF